MSIEKFYKIFDEDIRPLSVDPKDYTSVIKKEVVDKLVKAILALQCAKNVISKQSDLMMRSSEELLKQCEVNRKGSSTNDNLSSGIFSNNNSVKKSYSDTVKEPPVIVVKPSNQSVNIDRSEIEQLAESALINVKVKSARVNERGSLIVQVTDEKEHKNATERLTSSFSPNFTIEAPKLFLPKLTILNVPSHFSDANLLDGLCAKDDNFKQMLEGGESIEIIKCWDIKDGSGVISSKKIVVKCSPRVRKYIMETNNGYVYLNLSRCKVFDRYFVKKCYHCCGFNHIAKDCPEASKPPSCGKCAKPHKTQECNSTMLKCINCIRHRSGKPNNHSSTSELCPLFVREKNFIKDKTNYEVKN